MPNPLTLAQLAEDQARQGAENLALEFLMISMLKAMGPAVAANIVERTKGELMLAQGMAAAAVGPGYVEEAILMVEQIEASVTGKSRGPSRRSNAEPGAVPFDLSRLHRPQTGA